MLSLMGWIFCSKNNLLTSNIAFFLLLLLTELMLEHSLDNYGNLNILLFSKTIKLSEKSCSCQNNQQNNVLICETEMLVELKFYEKNTNYGDKQTKKNVENSIRKLSRLSAILHSKILT
jgi:hypothetical protein